MKRDHIWLNFVISVWLLILYCGFLFILNMANAQEIYEKYRPFASRAVLWPLSIGIVELILWFRPHRYRESGSRIMAGFMGTVLILFTLLVPLLVSSINEEINPSLFNLIFFLYISGSHIAFAIFGSEHR